MGRAQGSGSSACGPRMRAWGEHARERGASMRVSVGRAMRAWIERRARGPSDGHGAMDRATLPCERAPCRSALARSLAVGSPACAACGRIASARAHTRMRACRMPAGKRSSVPSVQRPGRMDPFMAQNACARILSVIYSTVSDIRSSQRPAASTALANSGIRNRYETDVLGPPS